MFKWKMAEQVVVILLYHMLCDKQQTVSVHLHLLSGTCINDLHVSLALSFCSNLFSYLFNHVCLFITKSAHSKPFPLNLASTKWYVYFLQANTKTNSTLTFPLYFDSPCFSGSRFLLLMFFLTIGQGQFHASLERLKN